MIKIFEKLDGNAINKFMTAHPNGELRTVENCLYYEYEAREICKPIASFMGCTKIRLTVFDSKTYANKIEDQELKELEYSLFDIFDSCLDFIAIDVIEMYFFDDFICFKSTENQKYYLNQKNNMVYTNPSMTKTYMDYNEKELNLCIQKFKYNTIIFLEKNPEYEEKNLMYNNFLNVIDYKTRIYGYDIYDVKEINLFSAIRNKICFEKGKELFIPTYCSMKEITPRFYIDKTNDKLINL